MPSEARAVKSIVAGKQEDRTTPFYTQSAETFSNIYHYDIVHFSNTREPGKDTDSFAAAGERFRQFLVNQAGYIAENHYLFRAAFEPSQ
jgi:hypothetical protein